MRDLLLQKELSFLCKGGKIYLTNENTQSMAAKIHTFSSKCKFGSTDAVFFKYFSQKLQVWRCWRRYKMLVRGAFCAISDFCEQMMNLTYIIRGALLQSALLVAVTLRGCCRAGALQYPRLLSGDPCQGHLCLQAEPILGVIPQQTTLLFTLYPLLLIWS